MKARSTRLAVEAMEDRSVPSTVAYGDFNNDGFVDMAAVTDPRTITISLANQDGSYTVSATLTVPNRLPVGGVQEGDYNADGNLDIRSGGLSNSRFYSHTWLGTGDGTFGDRTPKGQDASGLAGKPDSRRPPGEPRLPTEVLTGLDHAPAPGLRAGIPGPFHPPQTEEHSMTTSLTNRFRPSIDVLEHREAPSGLTTSPFAWLDEEPPILYGVRAAESGGANPKARPFHLKESGSAAFNGPIAVGTTINASASGQATHLGAFTLHDTSTIVEIVGPVLHIVGQADLEAANGDHLFASFTGTVNLATGEGTLAFEWTGGSTGGRFENATGATIWQVSVNQDLTYTAVADGVISY
jgi:hypothetical protein